MIARDIKTKAIMLCVVLTLSVTPRKGISTAASENRPKDQIHQSQLISTSRICGFATDLFLKLEKVRYAGDGPELRYFKDEKAVPWVSSLLASMNTNRITAVDVLAKIGNPSAVPDILRYLDKSIHEGEKASNADEPIVTARVAFQKSAVRAIESLLHEELLDERVFDNNEMGFLKDEVQSKVYDFMKNAENIWNSKYKLKSSSHCMLTNSATTPIRREPSEKELLACLPEDVARFCGIDNVLAAYEIYTRAAPFTSGEAVEKLERQGVNRSNALDYLEEHRAAIWLASLLDLSPDSGILERLKRIADPVVIPDILTALEKNVTGYVWNQNLGSYENWGAFQALAIQTVEQLLGKDMLNEQDVVKEIFPNNDLKPQARAQILDFINRARDLWQERKKNIEK